MINRPVRSLETLVESLLHDGWLARLRVLTRASLSVLLILPCVCPAAFLPRVFGLTFLRVWA